MTARASTPEPTFAAMLASAPPATRELVRLFGSKGPRHVFDVGACEGEDSIRYASLFPSSRIWTFEPVPANQALIRENLARLDPRHQCTLMPLALSDRAGTAELNVSSGQPPGAGSDWDYGNKSSSLLAPQDVRQVYPWLSFSNRITVPTDTLDHVCTELGLTEIDFVHMDVQGAEMLVLRGAASVLPRIGSLWLEVAEREMYAGQALRGELERFLASAGFRLTYAERRGPEGDQFYVNTRYWRSRVRLARLAVGRALLRLRSAARGKKA